MCIIIDTNTLASVFKKNSANHEEFKPVLDWIIDGKGIVIFGGTKYLEEIKKNYLNIFIELKKAKKAILIDNSIVDDETLKASNKIVHNDFDDQHLVGLLISSKCKLICSLDARAFPYFRHSTFFSPAKNKPRIYSSSTNSNLLCDRHIAELCKPCSNTTNAQKKLITQI